MTLVMLASHCRYDFPHLLSVTKERSSTRLNRSPVAVEQLVVESVRVQRSNCCSCVILMDAKKTIAEMKAVSFIVPIVIC